MDAKMWKYNIDYNLCRWVGYSSYSILEMNGILEIVRKTASNIGLQFTPNK